MLLKSIAGNLNREDWIIPAILYANVGMFVLSFLINPLKTGFSLNPLTFLSPDNGSLILLGATGTIPIHRFGRWWSLISANYLHGSILHIFFNMMAFRQIAPLIQEQFGGSRMIIIYTLSGMAGFWASYLAGVPLTIGASAALCGLMGAALYYGKSRGGAFGRAVFRQIGNWAVGLALFGLTGSRNQQLGAWRGHGFRRRIWGAAGLPGKVGATPAAASACRYSGAGDSRRSVMGRFWRACL